MTFKLHTSVLDIHSNKEGVVSEVKENRMFNILVTFKDGTSDCYIADGTTYVMIDNFYTPIKSLNMCP